VRKFIAIFLCSAANVAVGQTGGNHTMDFLQLPAHARIAAMGGVNVSLADKDVNFFHNNPALAGDTLNGFASAGYQFYVGGVGNALFTYAHNFPTIGQVILGVQHTDYGTIKGYDESGVETADYASGETAILLGRTHQIGNFRLGASLKGAFSSIAGYRAAAVMIDIGGIFKHPVQDLTIGLALKNMGVAVQEFSTSGTMKLPFDVQAGVSLKPEYMPLRFSFTAYQLAKKNLLYGKDLPPGERPSALQRVFSHLNVGAEILLHRNANILVGYNYLLHHALKWETGNPGAGVSFGFSLFVKPVEIIFSRSAYTVGNAGYSFTLSTDTNQFLKRRKF
jgi:hypothetical protein